MSSAGQRIGWVGIDARRGHLGVPKDALNHVDVYVQLAEQRSGRVASVLQPHVLDLGLAEDFLPFLSIDVRVRVPLGRVNLIPPMRFGQAFACLVQSGGQNFGHSPLCSAQLGGHGVAHVCLRPDVRIALGQSAGHGYLCHCSPQACASVQPCL